MSGFKKQATTQRMMDGCGYLECDAHESFRPGHSLFTNYLGVQQRHLPIRIMKLTFDTNQLKWDNNGY